MRPVATGDKGSLDWQLLSGLSLADIGLFVVGFGGLDAATAGAQTLLYPVGGMLCLVGLVLIWIGTSKGEIHPPQTSEPARARRPRGHRQEKVLVRKAAFTAGHWTAANIDCPAG